jgi:hypothetical protein
VGPWEEATAGHMPETPATDLLRHGGSTVRRRTSGDARWVRELASMCTLAEVAVVQSVRYKTIKTDVLSLCASLDSEAGGGERYRRVQSRLLEPALDPGHLDFSRLLDMEIEKPEVDLLGGALNDRPSHRTPPNSTAPNWAGHPQSGSERVRQSWAEFGGSLIRKRVSMTRQRGRTPPLAVRGGLRAGRPTSRRWSEPRRARHG